MPKWANTEQWTNTALAVMQAERNGDTMGAEQALKSLTSAYESIGQMKETEYKIRNLPTLERTSLAYMKTAETQAKEAEWKNEQQKRDYESMVKAVDILAPQLGVDRNILLSKLDIGKTATDIGTLAQTQERLGQKFYPAQVGMETSESLAKKEVADQALGQKLATFETAGKVAEGQGKSLTAIPSAEEKLATDVAKRKQEEIDADMQRRMNEARITDLLQTTGGFQDPGATYEKTTRLLTSQKTRLQQMQYLRFAINKSEGGAGSDFITNIINKLSPDLGAPDISGKTDIDAVGMINKWLDTSIPEQEQSIKMTEYIQKTSAREIGVPEGIVSPGKTKTTRQATTNPIYFNESAWDEMNVTLKNAYRTGAKAGIFIKTVKGSIPVDEYEKTKNFVPISVEAQKAINSLRASGVNKVNDISPLNVERLKKAGIYDEVIKGLGGK